MNVLVSILAALALIQTGAGVCPEGHNHAHAGLAAAGGVAHTAHSVTDSTDMHSMGHDHHAMMSQADIAPCQDDEVGNAEPVADLAGCCDGGACPDCTALTGITGGSSANLAGGYVSIYQQAPPESLIAVRFKFDPPPPKV